MSYTYLLSLLFLLLTTNWVNTASLRTFTQSTLQWSVDRRNSPLIVNDELVTPEPVLSRRRPFVPSSGRRKRWSKEEDNDEVEIPINESLIEQLTTSTTNIDNESTVSINNIEDIFSSTSTMTKEQSDMNSPEVNLTESLTMTSSIPEVNYPFLRKDIVESDTVANSSIDEDIVQSNKTDNEQSIENNDSLTTINDIIPLTTSNETNEIATTISEILSSNATDINQVVSNEKNESTADTIDNLTTMKSINDDTETSSMSISINQTVEETSIISQIEVSTMSLFDGNASATVLDQTTISSEEKNDNQTLINSETTIASEQNTAIIDESIHSTITSDTIQYDTTSIPEGMSNITVISNTVDDATIVTGQGISDTTISSDTIEYDTTVAYHDLSETSTMTDETQNDTSTIMNEEDEYSNDTTSSSSKAIVQPVCDFSCQCARECRYGFEIVNDTCQCDPPCKNYQCFGDDKCIVTDEGKPSCRPENGTEHDRPLHCYQPRDEGYHDIMIQYQSRWYYDPNQDTCHLFVYRGLGGNENNFATLHACHLECITCGPAADTGTCYGRIRMWHYDHKQKQCSEFDYSGCKGNENKFLKKQLCIDTCVSRILNL